MRDKGDNKAVKSLTCSAVIKKTTNPPPKKKKKKKKKKKNRQALRGEEIGVLSLAACVCVCFFCKRARGGGGGEAVHCRVLLSTGAFCLFRVGKERKRDNLIDK